MTQKHKNSSKLSSNNFFEGGFIKLPRHLLTMPSVAEMYEKEGSIGGWLYIVINLVLSNTATHWGILSGRQLDAFAREVHKSRSYVKHIILDNKDLFVIDGDKFTSYWMVEQYKMELHGSLQKADSPARTLYMHAEDIEIEQEKENKEKGTVRVSDDTHMTQGEDTSCPLAPSQEENDTNVNYTGFSNYLKR